MERDIEVDRARAKFHQAVFETLNAFSYLDLNLGLCLSHLKCQEDPQSTYTWLSSMSCAQKIEELEKLVSNSEIGQSYSAWSRSSPRIRAIRNSFAHGVWEYLPTRREKPVGLKLPAWVRIDAEIPSSLSINELEAMAADLNQHFQEFLEWRRRSGV